MYASSVMPTTPLDEHTFVQGESDQSAEAEHIARGIAENFLDHDSHHEKLESFNIPIEKDELDELNVQVRKLWGDLYPYFDHESTTLEIFFNAYRTEGDGMYVLLRFPGNADHPNLTGVHSFIFDQYSHELIRTVVAVNNGKKMEMQGEIRSENEDNLELLRVIERVCIKVKTTSR